MKKISHVGGWQLSVSLDGGERCPLLDPSPAFIPAVPVQPGQCRYCWLVQVVCSVPFLGLAATRFFWIMKLCGIANLSWLSAGLVHAFLECKVSCKISSIFLCFFQLLSSLGECGWSVCFLGWPGVLIGVVWVPVHLCRPGSGCQHGEAMDGPSEQWWQQQWGFAGPGLCEHSMQLVFIAGRNARLTVLKRVFCSREGAVSNCALCCTFHGNNYEALLWSNLLTTLEHLPIFNQKLMCKYSSVRGWMPLRFFVCLFLTKFWACFCCSPSVAHISLVIIYVSDANTVTLSLGWSAVFAEQGGWHGCSAAAVCLQYLWGSFAGGLRK